jgi:hypothetical protein
MKTKLIIYLLFVAQFSSYAQTKKVVPPSITGKWDVWIPGAITYLQKDASVYQVYESGSAMSQLHIAADGSYQWGNSKSKLTEVKPWYADENRRYFSIKDLRDNVYDFWYKEQTDELVFLFGEVGGHAATGSRVGDKLAGKNTVDKPAPSTGKAYTDALKTPIPDSKPKDKSTGFSVNDKVLVLWSGSWYKAQILEYKTSKYLVRYEGWGALYDEWVTVDKIKKAE